MRLASYPGSMGAEEKSPVYTACACAYLIFANHVDLGGRERNDIKIFVGVRVDVHSSSCLRWTLACAGRRYFLNMQ